MRAVTGTHSSYAYRYGFNGMEKDNEVKGVGNSYTAMFWQYDSRLGRRWNRDPKPNPSISNYACFANSPIWITDPYGDTTQFFSKRGSYLGQTNDGHSNQIHFTTNRKFKSMKNVLGDMKSNADSPEDDKNGYNNIVSYYRKNSIAFISKNTISQIKSVFNESRNEEKERGGALVIGENREIQFYDLSTNVKRTSHSMNGRHLTTDIYSLSKKRNVFGSFHVHWHDEKNVEKPSTFYPMSDGHSIKSYVDYTSFLTNGNAAIIISNGNLTIHPTIKPIKGATPMDLSTTLHKKQGSLGFTVVKWNFLK